MRSYLAFFLSAWLLKEPLVIGADPIKDLCQIYSTQSIEDQCDAYCFSNTKINYELTLELQKQVVTKEKTIQNLMKEIKKGNSQRSEQNKQLKSKDGKVIELTKNIKGLRSELFIAEAEIETRDAQINEKTNQLNSCFKNNTDQSELPQNKDDKVNAMTETIGNLERELGMAKNETQIKNSQVFKLTENNENLKNEIKNKDERIKKQGKDIATKDSQINDLSNQIKSNSIKISEITDDLLKCYPISRCPIEGPSAIYNITVGGINTFEAPCNSTGWQTIQKRFDGSENFDRTWKDYKDGFGNIKGEFFIGLERLHLMTEERSHELYIKLGKVDGSEAYAHYDDFKIGSEDELYELKSLGIYNGTAGDSLKNHKNMKFTTRDRKNDESEGNCASDERGGWWHKACGWSQLNGKFFKVGNTGSKKVCGIHWGSWHNYDYTYSLTFVEMMIRPKTKTEA